MWGGIDLIGETIRKFNIISELGVGGYGVVYKAHDTDVNRDVALKVILPQYADDPDFKQRFESEAQLVAQLESRQIVPLYDYWHDERGAFLVMRLIRGGSLRRIMTKQEALPLAQALRIVSDIAEALAVAHENDVVHRDLKPENILIDERGNAYLTDFGIAKQRNKSINLTATDAIVGTLAYISPEQINNEEVLPQSDIYAFGIMLYEMLAGRHPYDANNVGALLVKHIQEPMPSILEVRPDLPARLDDVLAKATAKEATERYTSTLDMLEDLKAIANSSSTGIVGNAANISKPTRKQPSTPEERNRFAMLDNIRTFWIHGVLENSLHDAAMIDLGLKPEQGRVDNPWETVVRTPMGDDVTSDESILEIFENMNGKLLILGEPGSGKTTTLLTLARDLLTRAEADSQHPIPVILNLSSWSEKQQPLQYWVTDELSNKYQVPRKIAEQWVTDEAILLLLDGLDEVAEDLRDACIHAINAYREAHGFVDVVVCSRIKDYDVLESQLRLNGAIVIQPLDDVQIMSYLQILGQEVSAARALITMDAQMRELAKSPLMLSIIILAYRNKTAGDMPDFDDIEAQRQHLFDVYVERMFERRVGDVLYTKEETSNYLSWLARQMQAHQNSLFLIEYLKSSWLTADRRDNFYRNFRLVILPIYGFAWGLPVLIYEYFTATPIGVFSVLYAIAGMAVAWVFSGTKWDKLSHLIGLGLLFGLAWGVGLAYASNNLLIGLAAFALLSIVWTLGLSLVPRTLYDVGYSRDNIGVVGILRFSRKHLNLWAGGLIGLGGVATVILVRLIFGPETVPLINYVLGGLASGISFSLIVIMLTGLVSSEIEMQTVPNQSIRVSLTNANRVGAVAFLLFLFSGIFGYSLVSSLTLGLTLGIIHGMSVGIAIWGMFGGLTVMSHVALRISLQNAGFVPRNYARFLDYATDLILLRKVGGGYIFIHRYLLEYFADLDTSDSGER